MSEINIVGPAKYRFQDTVAVLLSLMHLRHDGLSLHNEPSGPAEDLRLSWSGPFTAEIQVKGGEQPVSVASLAEVLAHFGGRQHRQCLLDRLIAGNTIVLVASGDCDQQTSLYREKPVPLDQRKSRRDLRNAEADALLTELRAMVPQGKPGTDLHAKRLAHLNDSIAGLTVSEFKRALDRLVIWDRLDEPTLRASCRELLVSERVPLDRIEGVIDSMWVAARADAEGRRDTVPQIKGLLAAARQTLRRAPHYVQRSDQNAMRQVLERDHTLLLSGVPRCGKTEMAKAILEDLAAQGYEIKISFDPSDACAFLQDQSSRMRACLLDDPFGSRGELEERIASRQTLVRQAVQVVGPGRLLIVAQSHDELLRTFNTRRLEDCRLGSGLWQDVGQYPQGFLLQCWDSLAREAGVGERLRERVAEIITRGSAFEVGALAYLAAWADELGADSDEEHLLEIVRRDAAGVAAALETRLGPLSTRLMIVLSLCTRPGTPVAMRDLAFVLGDAQRLPGQALVLGLHILTGEAGSPTLPDYEIEPQFAADVLDTLDMLEARRLIWQQGNRLNFTHSFYRAAGEVACNGLTLRASREIVALCRRAMLCRSPVTSRAAARALGWLAASIHPDTLSELYKAALDGTRSIFPTTKDLCFRMLFERMDDLPKDVAHVLKERRAPDDRFYLYEWQDGEPWLPYEQNSGAMIERWLDTVTTEEPVEPLAGLAREIPSLPSTQEAARCLTYLETAPYLLTARQMRSLLTYDLSLVRAEAAKCWLSVARTADEDILDIVFADLSPQVIVKAMRGLCAGARNLPADRVEALVVRLATAAAKPQNAYGLLAVLSRFSCEEEFPDPPWRIFGRLMPAVLRSLDVNIHHLASGLWSACDNAARRLPAADMVAIASSWVDVLEAQAADGLPDDFLAGVSDLLLTSTKRKHAALRTEVSRRLLGWEHTPTLMAFLHDYVHAWCNLTAEENALVRDRLTGNRLDRRWLRAAVLTAAKVPAELQEMLGGDARLLRLPPDQLIDRMPADLLEACLHVYCGTQPFWWIGIHHRGKATWVPVVQAVAKRPSHPMFEIALNEEVRSMDGLRVKEIVTACGPAHAERIFELLLAHKVRWNGNWLSEAWETLLELAEPEMRERWFDRMAELAPGILDDLSEVEFWLTRPEHQYALWERLRGDIDLLVMCDGAAATVARHSDIGPRAAMAIGMWVENNPPVIMGTYSRLQDKVRKLAPGAVGVLESLEKMRRTAVERWKVVRENHAPKEARITSWK